MAISNRSSTARLICLSVLVLAGASLASSAQMYEIVYEPLDGSLQVIVPESLPDMTTLSILSESRSFTGDPPDYSDVGVASQFDIFNPGQLFRINPWGFGSTDYGPVLTPGLTSEFLLSDLTVLGSRVGGGSLGDFVFGTGILLDPQPNPAAPSERAGLEYSAEYGFGSAPQELPGGHSLRDPSILAVGVGDGYGTGIDPPDYLLDFEALDVPVDLGDDDRIRFSYDGPLATLIVAFDSEVEQPLLWMNDPSLTGLPAPFYPTGDVVGFDFDYDGVADREFTFWATLMPDGEDYALPFASEKMMVFVGEPIPIPEPRAVSVLVLPALVLLGPLRRSRHIV